MAAKKKTKAPVSKKPAKPRAAKVEPPASRAQRVARGNGRRGRR